MWAQKREEEEWNGVIGVQKSENDNIETFTSIQSSYKAGGNGQRA